MLINHNASNEIRWNRGERLNHLFERRCDQLVAEGKADHLAVYSHDRELTFTQLDVWANQCARYLFAQGIRAGDRVGVMFDKVPETYAALLAIMKLNVAFVPVDASFPNDRIAFIFEDAEVKAIVSLSCFAEKLEGFSLPVLFIDTAEKRITSMRPERLDATECEEIEDQLSYIIYTSGTTGKPKGVTIEHAAICNFVSVAAEIYGVTENDRSYQGMTIAFDFSVEELWVPLMAGATLVPGKPGVSLVGDELADYLLQYNITYLAIVPTLLATINKELPALKTLLVSGEACPPNLVNRWHQSGRIILNAYGPTEATVTCTLTELYPNKPVTIGQPLPTYTMLILDENSDRELMDGDTGEIAVAGVGLARDYLNRPQLTRQKFIPDFLGVPNNPTQRIYRTGDLGRINSQGEIEYLGRIDTQVKIRGYRIELGEIESVLMKLPEVAHVVVNTWENAQDVTELAAYYSLKPGQSAPRSTQISELMSAELPAYMRPAYLMELPVIPMTPSNKVDRNALPSPSGARFFIESAYVAPESATEEVLATTLASVMDLPRISITQDFFKELGAHSLLMAQFAAKVRQIPDLVSLSMSDIYQNPSIRQLAALLDERSGENTDNGNIVETARRPLHIPSNFSYFGCGTLQFLFSFTYSLFLFWFMIEGVKWTYKNVGNWTDLYVHIVVFASLTFVVFSVIPILAKWLLIGKWKAQSFPVWSLRYFRFWVVKTLLQLSPMMLFVGSPLYNIYLRLLGAKIGKDVVIQSRIFPLTTDLLTLGEKTILRKGVMAPGYRAESGYITLGAVTIGSQCYVGVASVVDIDSEMEDDTQLAHTSSLHRSQRLISGKRYHGSPAQETSTHFSDLESMEVSNLRKVLYTLYQLALPLLILTPVVIMVLYSLLPVLSVQGIEDGKVTAGFFDNKWLDVARELLPITTILFFGSLLIGLLVVFVVPRICHLFLKEGKTYVLYGVHYQLQLIIERTSNFKIYNLLFGDSSAIVYYMRWVGYNLNKVFQTGSNFGVNQKHDNPFFCNIGSSTMAADGLTMINEEMSSTSFVLHTTKIGSHNYLGNFINVPWNNKVGDNCLLGSKVMLPVDGTVRENVGLLGSPSFEIPRAVDQDKDLITQIDEQTRLRKLKQKNLHNTVTALAFLTGAWGGLYIILLATYLNFSFLAEYGILSVAVYALLFPALVTAYYVLLERGSLGFKGLKPRHVSIYDYYFWTHERYWKFTAHPLDYMYRGTPMKTIVNRLLGVKVGKKVFDDGSMIVEKALISIGDYASLNQGASIQGHSLEEGAFKSDYIEVGKGCTISCGALVHYGVKMADNVVVETDSFLMKGEMPTTNSIWRGNPAKPVSLAVTTADSKCLA
ncbi:MAG: FIG00793273: hypothetical protein [uncultured Thiotrichaceae bacterium]|uniref:Carrier domain-containing protein n=1 Tax=uncultured Thiotrichaceae bacterium TaxID=298394 RepID=A0A6S6U7R9_9GAMM|nr:MAG: FIG00793273: hypothetical protein [uncultured Thiotrichaceae bacterium]